ncbi:nuclear transport factor 2 family protein [Marivita sp. S2033]|uniref:nuclear transport factor 2 family protein n=1 Tax=Marivita sp. S2033 TaxID=3373187 RepID=UPI0039823EFD
MTERLSWQDMVALRFVAESYGMAVDRNDAARFAAQFTPDGILESPRGRFCGQAELASVPGMMAGLYDRTHHGVVGQVPVLSDGGVVRADTYTHARHYYAARRDGAEYCYEMTIRYEDRFVNNGDSWLLAHRILVLVGDATYRTGRDHEPDTGDKTNDH